MPDKMDRFTKHARHVLQIAQEEAARLNHNYVGTEHLLLGLGKGRKWPGRQGVAGSRGGSGSTW